MPQLLGIRRRARNRIDRLLDSTVMWKTDPKDIESIAVDFFSSLMAQPQLQHNPLSLPSLLLGRVSDQDNAILLAPVTFEEVRSAVFSMGPPRFFSTGFLPVLLGPDL